MDCSNGMRPSGLPVSLNLMHELQSNDTEEYWEGLYSKHLSSGAKSNRRPVMGDAGPSVRGHPTSWKQLVLGLVLQRELEQFGSYLELPPGYEEEFCRPPIDGSHPRWLKLYPRSSEGTHRMSDGLPSKERFCESSSEPSYRGDSGWPRLERLKAIAATNTQAYASSFAWSALDRAALRASLQRDHDGATLASASTSGAGISVAGSAASASTTARPATGGKAAPPSAGAKKGVKPSSSAQASVGNAPSGGDAIVSKALAALLPFVLTADAALNRADSIKQLSDDLADVCVTTTTSAASTNTSSTPSETPVYTASATTSRLREFVSPARLEEWKASGKWWPKAPQQGQDSINAVASGGKAPLQGEDSSSAVASVGQGLAAPTPISPAASNTFRGASVIAVREAELATLLELVGAVGTCSDGVTQLVLRQLPSHLDFFSVLAPRLPRLASLSLSYGSAVKQGMRRDASTDGMRTQDALSIATYLRACAPLVEHQSGGGGGPPLSISVQQTWCGLRHLALPNCRIDDSLLTELLPGLMGNASLVSLDLSHNDITTEGVLLLARALGPASTSTKIGGLASYNSAAFAAGAATATAAGNSGSNSSITKSASAASVAAATAGNSFNSTTKSAPTSATAVASAPRMPHLAVLRLACNRIGDGEVEADNVENAVAPIGASIVGSRSAFSAAASDSRVAYAARVLGNTVAARSSLRVLDLTSNYPGLGDAAGAELIRALFARRPEASSPTAAARTTTTTSGSGGSSGALLHGCLGVRTYCFPTFEASISSSASDKESSSRSTNDRSTAAAPAGCALRELLLSCNRLGRTTATALAAVAAQQITASSQPSSMSAPKLLPSVESSHEHTSAYPPKLLPSAESSHGPHQSNAAYSASATKSLDAASSSGYVPLNLHRLDITGNDFSTEDLGAMSTAFSSGVESGLCHVCYVDVSTRASLSTAPGATEQPSAGDHRGIAAGAAELTVEDGAVVAATAAASSLLIEEADTAMSSGTTTTTDTGSSRGTASYDAIRAAAAQSRAAEREGGVHAPLKGAYYAAMVMSAKEEAKGARGLAGIQ